MVVVAGLGVAAVGGGYVYVMSQLNASGIDVYSTDGETFAPPTAEEINGPINILVIGSDTRVGQGKTSYGPAGNALADVIILLHVSADRKNAVALSFPRDLMVSVPECPNPEGGEKYSARDMVQINATMNTGGPACTLLTVQQLTGVKIPYLAMIDFKGVIAMSEAVGGVTVCVAEPIKDDYTQLYLEAGEHTLIGEQALAFLRTRHGVGDGSDLSRISNQQVFLTSLVRKLKDEGALTNPFTMLKLGTAALENMTLSNSLTEIGVSGAYSGRVGVIKDQAQLLFDRLAKDESLVLAEANPGSGAVVAEESAPAVEPTSEASASASEEALPEWVQGTNASVKSCSN